MGAVAWNTEGLDLGPRKTVAELNAMHERLDLARDDESLTNYLSPDAAALWGSNDFREAAGQHFVKLYKRARGSENNRRLTDTEIAFRDRLFSSYGLDKDQTENIWSAWGSFKPWLRPGGHTMLWENGRPKPELVDRFTDEMTKSFSTMATLERGMRGSVAALNKDYGIRQFGRYKEIFGDLLWQLQYPNNYAARASVMAAEDWTNVTHHHPKTMLDSDKFLPQTVFFEAESAEEAGTMLLRDAHRRGAFREVVVAAHGGRTGFTLSSNTDTGTVTPESITKFLPKGVIMPGGTLNVAACSVGQYASREFSRQIKGIRVKAADRTIHGVTRNILGSDRYKGGVRRTRSGKVKEIKVRPVKHGPTVGGALVRRAVYRAGQALRGAGRPVSPQN